MSAGHDFFNTQTVAHKLGLPDQPLFGGNVPGQHLS